MFNLFKSKEIPVSEEQVSEPLSEGEKMLLRGEYVPIRASLIDIDDVDDDTKASVRELQTSAVDIDYYEYQRYYTANNMKNDGHQTYVISDCNTANKYSREYYNCTGVIFVGQEKDGTKQISFMSHQDPDKFFYDSHEEFKRDLEERINEFYSKVKSETVDAIILGGNFKDKDAPLNEYIESIKFLSELTQDATGKVPTVITGPNQHPGETNAYFDTQRRRLYICRPFQENNIGNKDYMPSQLKEQSEQWIWKESVDDDENNNINNN